MESVAVPSSEAVFQGNKVDGESLNNITTDTSMESTMSQLHQNDNVPMVVTSTEIDPDIDIAAEQIVNDFTEHLNQRAFPSSVEALTDDEEAIGVMSTSLAAGGFEEMIVGLDKPANSNNNSNGMDDSNVYIVEDVDDDDEVEEEVIDSSYEEEEITEVEEYMDDVDIEEIMEESGMIIAEDKKQLQTDGDGDDDVKEISRDESIHGVTPDEPPASTDAQNMGRSNHTMASGLTMDSQFATGTTMTNLSGNSYNDDSLAVSESTRNTNVTELQAQQQQAQGQPLYGDVLLGDMSEMTMGTRTDTDSYFHTDFSNVGGVPAAGNLLSQVQDDDDDTFDVSEPHASKKQDNSYAMASAATLTAAVAAAAAEEAIHGDPAMKSTRSKSINSGTTIISENSATPSDYYSSSQSKNTSTMPVPPALSHQMSVPPALQKTPTQEEQGKMSALPTNHENNEIPVPPALSGAPSQSYNNDGVDDIEMGKKVHGSNRFNGSKGPEMAQSANKNDGVKTNTDDANQDKDKDKEDDNEDISEGMNLSIYASVVLCLAVIFMVVMLSIFLTRKDDEDRDIAIPTPAPVVAVQPVATAPVVPPTLSSEPPTVLGTWTKSINPVLGVEGSRFGSSIVMDDNNMWSVGAPEMVDNNTVTSGGVISSTYADNKWSILPFLHGENSGDMFGSAIDMSANHMVVGAPMSLIANTTTPAGAAYFYYYNPSNLAWDKSTFTFRSVDDILATNGEFGHSVALGFDIENSNLPRVVVGAPKHSQATSSLENGCVYTFAASSVDSDAEWSAMEATPIFGKNEYDWFGFSVDMSKDGKRFIVGAPSGSNAGGYFQMYEWDGTKWVMDFEDFGVTGEAFGSYVTFINEDMFAVGGPGFENGSGRVIVYQQSADMARSLSEYAVIGEPIIGSSGDRLGAHGSVTGGKHGDTEDMILIVATANGTIATYSLDQLAGKWKPHIAVLSSGANGTIFIEYSTSVGLITGDPDNDEVSLYNTVPGALINNTADAPATSPVVAESLLPTVSPVGGTVVATETPVIATVTAAPNEANTTTEPPVDGQSWVLVAENFTPEVEDGSDYGSSVSLTDTTLAVGSAKTLGNGAVFIYTKNSSWTTVATQELFGNAAGVEYGASVDLSSDDAWLAVGAPRTFAADTITEFGAAYCYQLTNGQYQLMGDVIRGDADIYSASEMFGSSIAVSTTAVAVGAPFSNYEAVLLRGRVYLYSFDSATNSWLRTSTFQGQTSNSTFGTSMDMSTDGSRLIVGAPGTNYAEIYVNDGSQWLLDYVINSSTADSTTAGFGTLVVAISNNIFAISDPNFNDKLGRVVIYTRNDSNAYVQIGDIAGTVPSVQFGTFLTGTIDPNTSIPSVVIGSTDGTIVRYDYDGSAWIQHPTTLLSTNLGSDITSVSSSGSSSEVVVTDTQNAEIYQW